LEDKKGKFQTQSTLRSDKNKGTRDEPSIAQSNKLPPIFGDKRRRGDELIVENI
jgi:hypothetical protein